VEPGFTLYNRGRNNDEMVRRMIWPVGLDSRASVAARFGRRSRKLQTQPAFVTLIGNALLVQ
jgi:hypothetical protein